MGTATCKKATKIIEKLQKRSRSRRGEGGRERSSRGSSIAQTQISVAVCSPRGVWVTRIYVRLSRSVCTPVCAACLTVWLLSLPLRTWPWHCRLPHVLIGNCSNILSEFAKKQRENRIVCATWNQLHVAHPTLHSSPLLPLSLSSPSQVVHLQRPLSCSQSQTRVKNRAGAGAGTETGQNQLRLPERLLRQPACNYNSINALSAIFYSVVNTW